MNDIKRGILYLKGKDLNISPLQKTLGMLTDAALKDMVREICGEAYKMPRKKIDKVDLLVILQNRRRFTPGQRRRLTTLSSLLSR